MLQIINKKVSPIYVYYRVDNCHRIEKLQSLSDFMGFALAFYLKYTNDYNVKILAIFKVKK